MKINKPLKIVGYTLFAAIFLILGAHLGVNFLIKNRLPKIIEEKNDTAYDFTYEDLNFSIFNNSISVSNARVYTKENSDIKKDIDFFGSIKKVSVTGVNFVQLLKNKNLKAFTIVLEKPEITVLQTTKKDTLPTHSQLPSSLDIDEILVKNATLSLMSSAGDTLYYKIYNLNANIDGIHMGEYTVKKDIPFTYADYKFKIDSVYSLLNRDQFLTTGYVDISSQHILIDNVKIYPLWSSKEFKTNQTHSNTRMSLSIPKVKLTHTDWGYDPYNLYVKVGGIEIDSIQFHITDQKNQKVVQQAKVDAEKIVQPLIPFRLDVDSLTIKKSSFNSLGIVQVKNVNIVAKNISNRLYEHLLVDEFILKNPQLIHSPRQTSNKSNDSEASKINDHIRFNKIKIIDAEYILQNNKGKKVLFVKNFNLGLDDVEITDKTINENIPFLYKNPQIHTGEVTFDAGEQYMLYSDGMRISPTKIVLKNMRMKPKMTRKQHASTLRWGQDYYIISFGMIELSNYSWGFDVQNEGYFTTDYLTINQADATIIRDVSIPNAPKENPLFSKKLRKIPFNFYVKNLQLIKSNLVYQETGDIKREPGKLTFSNFNLSAQNIYSGYKRKSGPKTHIKVKTIFMKNSLLDADWTMNIMDPIDTFTIKGTIKDFDVVAMSPFLKPYLKVSMNGKIHQMKFDFNGNNNTANGLYGMDFSELKITVLREDGSKKKLLSAVGNMFVRTDSKGMREVDIKPVERIKEKSFFNFLWRCILQGLKQTIL